MTILLRLVSVVALVLVAAVTSWSYPTIYGETGLIQVPTADVVPYAVLNLAVDYTQPNIAGKFNQYPCRITYGLGPGTELYAIDAIATGSSGDYKVFGAGFKYVLMPEDVTGRMPGWAVGGRVTSIKAALERLDVRRGVYHTVENPLSEDDPQRQHGERDRPGNG